MKNILILCTGNSCRSIIAEAILNNELDQRIVAYSSGTNPSGRVNLNAKKVLLAHNAWRDVYHSKVLDKVMVRTYDLVITVCDNAKESCPIFSKDIVVKHISFEDPDGKEYKAFEATYNEIRERLLPEVVGYFNL